MRAKKYSWVETVGRAAHDDLGHQRADLDIESEFLRRLSLRRLRGILAFVKHASRKHVVPLAPRVRSIRASCSPCSKTTPARIGMESIPSSVPGSVQ